MTEPWQPVPPPATIEEFHRLVDAGVLVDIGGQPLRRLEECPCCGMPGPLSGETCPASLPCPDCGSTSKRCYRPSGHEAAEWHTARLEAAEADMDERVQAGDTTVPRRWARPTQHSLFT